MTILLRKSDVFERFGGTAPKVALAFAPFLDKPLARQAPLQWGEFLPELRARQLIEHYPDMKDLVVDPKTGLSLREMRSRLIAGEANATEARPE